MTHRAVPQADGHPGTVDRTDVALAICALVASAKLAGVPLIAVLQVIADTWDVDVAAEPDAFSQAAERITS